jgi:hypothetical protein
VTRLPSPLDLGGELVLHAFWKRAPIVDDLAAAAGRDEG